jgi:cytochrome c oxidase subunit 1
MVFFSFSNHIAGLMGVPRRVYETGFGGAEVAKSWELLTTLSALGGVILFASAGLFVLVMFATLLGGAREGQRPIEWAEALGGVQPARGLWDKLGIWFVIAVVLVIIAYGLPLYDHFQLERFGSPGFKPF